MLITDWLQQWRGRREKRRLRRPRYRSGRLIAGWAAECLEARTLLSNVAVSVDDGVVKLAGDTGDHTIDVSVVSGNLRLVGSSGTTFTFNGTTSASTDLPLSPIGTIRGFEITMQGGNDTIHFDATNLGTIAGKVEVNLGDGTN